MPRLTIVILILAIAADACAATWRVEKDGSGDFMVIQDAVDASANGDTILIGPGRFDDTVTFTNPYVTWTVCVVVPGTDLTFIGMGRNATFIGPAVPGEMSDDGWRGFINWPMEVGRLVVEGVTVENMFSGFQVDTPSLMITNCRISGCGKGILALNVTAPLVERCDFTENGTGVEFYSCERPIIRNCTFIRSSINEYMTGAYLRLTTDYLLENCYFEMSDIQCDISTGTIRGCTLWNCYQSSMRLISGSYIIEDNEIDGTQHAWCIKLESWSEVIARGNILKNASWSAVHTTSSRASFSGNHIFSNADFVVANGFSTPPLIELDFRNNYWGTSDPLEIASRIKDGNDDPGVHAHVLYDPYSDIPMSNEEQSWGEIKALYHR